MKVIARIDRSTLIVEASEKELARACGYYYEGQMPDQMRPEVGRELSVTEAYESATNIITGSAELAKAKDALLKVVAAVEKFQAVLDPKAALIKSKLPKT